MNLGLRAAAVAIMLTACSAAPTANEPPGPNATPLRSTDAEQAEILKVSISQAYESDGRALPLWIMNGYYRHDLVIDDHSAYIETTMPRDWRDRTVARNMCDAIARVAAATVDAYGEPVEVDRVVLNASNDTSAIVACSVPQPLTPPLYSRD